jgi:hypothetical protein
MRLPASVVDELALPSLNGLKTAKFILTMLGCTRKKRMALVAIIFLRLQPPCASGMHTQNNKLITPIITGMNAIIVSLVKYTCLYAWESIRRRRQRGSSRS